MTFRLVATPLAPRIDRPAPRPGGVRPELLPAFLAVPQAEASLSKLEHPDVVVVTTGQQPGLFTGPLYTIHKALSAASLAGLLEQRWERPVVPVFWIAGDDHDFAEANHSSWLSSEGELVTVVLRTREPDAPLTPMYREPLGTEVNDALRRLVESLPASEFRAETVNWLERHYRPDQTVAGSFAGALAELLAPLGVMCLDSSHLAIKRAASPHLLRALELAPELDRALVQRAKELRDIGADPGVPVGDGATLVMLEGKLGRDRLVADAGAYVTRRAGERFDLAGLRRVAADDPLRLSPNVLLRPVVESALLPTVGYVAGPGELRYFELTAPVYEHLAVARQIPVPRWSGVIVEARVERVLEKFGADLSELMQPGGMLENRVVRTQVPEQATSALASLQRAIEEEYARLERAVAEIDPTLEKPIHGARNQALAGSHEVEKRLVQHLKRRQEIELTQIGRSRAAVLPAGKPQERVLTVAPFLARYGSGFLSEVSRTISEWYGAALEGDD